MPVLSYSNLSKKKLKELNNTGQTLPAEFYDKYQIYSKENSDITEASNYLYAIIKNILQANQKQIKQEYEVDLTNFSYKIFISMDESINALTISDTSPAILIVNAGLLKNVQSEDELAGILAHEIHHQFLPKITRHDHQGQLGECACDIWSVRAIRNAGYEPDRYADFFRRNNTANTNIFDSHPSEETRIRHIENTQVILDKQQGKKDFGKKSLQKVIGNLPVIKIVTGFEKYLKGLGVAEHKTAVENIAILIAGIKNNIIPIHFEYDDLFQLNDTVIAAIKSLFPIPADQNEEFFKKLLELKKWLLQDQDKNLEFVSICNNWIKENSLYKSDKHYLWKFVNAMNSMTSKELAADYEAIKTNATVLIKTMSNHPEELQKISISKFKTTLLFDEIKSFDLPDSDDINALRNEEEIIPSWENLVRHAITEYKNEKTTYIAQVLYSMGINKDPRLIQIKKESQFFEFTLVDTQKLIKEDLGTKHDSIIKFYRQYESLIFNDKGRIINSDLFQRKLQEQILTAVNWGELRSPPIGIGFENFVKKYRDSLNIEFDREKCNTNPDYTFMQNFLEEIQQLPKGEIDFLKNSNVFEEFFNHYITDYLSLEHLGGLIVHLDVTHPIIQFLNNKEHALHFFNSKKNWLELRDKFLSIANYTTIENPSGYQWNLDNHQLFGYPLFKTLDDLKLFITNLPIKEGIAAFRMGRLYSLKKMHIEVAAVYYEIHQFVKNHREQITLDDIHFLDKLQIKYTKEDYYIPFEIKSELDKEFAEIKRSIINKELFSKANDIHGLDTCVNIYVKSNSFFKEYGFGKVDNPFFSDSNNFLLQQKLLEKIMTLFAQIEKNTPIDKKINICEKIIFKDEIYLGNKDIYNRDKYSYAYTPSFTDIKQRSRLFNLYVNQLAESFGKDDGSNKFKVQVDKIIKNCDLTSASEILKLFADKVIAQRELSFYIRDKLRDNVKANIAGMYVECDAVFRLVEQSSEKDSPLLLKFLTKPFSSASGKELFDNFSSKWNVEFFKTTGWNYSPNEEIKLKILHANFWQLPELARAGLLQKLLYPVNSKKLEQEIASEANQFVLDSVLPLNISVPEAKQEDNSYLEERKIVKAYLSASSLKEERLILSVLLASSDPRLSAENKKSRGEVVKIVLNYLGPAGTKLSQAIGSHPRTPETLREEMNKAKFMADKPSRWELFELIEEVYHPKKDILYVDNILGAGTYGVTVQVLKNNGCNTAITLLRRDVAERAESEYSTLSKAADNLVRIDNKYQPIIDMINQAQASAKKETNMQLADEQDKVAGVLYNNKSVSITENGNTKTYYFFKADWVNHDARYKETAIVPGDHFIDLPQRTETERAEKRLIAIAVLTLEIKNLIAGYQFDHDRHDAQQRIIKNHIGQFDFGGISLKPPTKVQKQLLGKIIGKVIKDTTEGQDLIVSLRHAIANTQVADDADKNYLASVELAVLALNNYAKFLKPNDFKAILSSIKNHIDPVMEESIKSYLGTSWLFKHFSFSKSETLIEIKSVDIQADDLVSRQQKKQEEKMISVLNAIRSYISNPAPNLSFFAKRFDPKTGKDRAQFYLTLLMRNDSSATDKQIILYALLTHKGTELRLAVSRALGFTDHQEAARAVASDIHASVMMDATQWKACVKNIVKPLQKAIEKKQPPDLVNYISKPH